MDGQKGDKTKISLEIDNSSLEFITNSAKSHQMSRTGFMVFASLKYAKEMKQQEADEVLDRCL